MALIHCPECGSEISEVVAVCPNCGHRSQAVWRAIWPTLRQFAWPAFALLIMLGAGAFLRRTMRADIAKRRSDQRVALSLTITAAEACQQIVLNNLRSPATARFSTGDGGTIQMPSGDSILVLGTVEAENQSGGMVKSRYSCGMRRDSLNGVWVGRAFVAAAVTSRRPANVVPR